MTTQTTEIVYRTQHDVWLATTAVAAIKYIDRLLTHPLPFFVAVDLGSQNGSRVTYADVVQLALDVLNDECPSGYWYYITSDANLALDMEDDS